MILKKIEIDLNLEISIIVTLKQNKTIVKS